MSKKNSIYSKAAKYEGSKEVVVVVRWFLFSPTFARKCYNKYSCRHNCKAMSKSPLLLLFAKGKTSTKIFPLPLKITFRLLCEVKENEGFCYPGNKSTKIKTKRIRIRKRRVRNGQYEKALGQQDFMVVSPCK